MYCLRVCYTSLAFCVESTLIQPLHCFRVGKTQRLACVGCFVRSYSAFQVDFGAVLTVFLVLSAARKKKSGKSEKYFSGAVLGQNPLFYAGLRVVLGCVLRLFYC